MKDNNIQAVKIDLEEYVRAGEGANGASYNHRNDPDIMLKLNNKGADVGRVLRELEVARKVYQAGIPTPEPGDFVTDGERYGLRFRRIRDKKSFARACGDNPENAETYGRDFAEMCRSLHSTVIDTSKFCNVKDYYLDMLEPSKFYTDEEKRRIREFIVSAPDANTAVHGDLQFGNAIFAGEKKYFIDLENFCYGHPYFDLGMVYLVNVRDDDEFLMEAFHTTKDVSLRFWEAFVGVYFEGRKTAAEAGELLKPYAALKNLIIERDSKGMVPTLREIYKESILR